MKKYKLEYNKGDYDWWWYAYRIYFGWLVSLTYTDFASTKEDLIQRLKDRENKKYISSEIVEI